MPTTTWTISPRPWHHGYSDADDEQRARIIADLFEDRYGTRDAERIADEAAAATGLDMPPILVEAILYPVVSYTDFVRELACWLDISPGTLIDEIELRASRTTEAGDDNGDDS